MKRFLTLLKYPNGLLVLSLWVMAYTSGSAQRQPAERLDRGVVAINLNNQTHISWRLLEQDPQSCAFDVYKETAEGTLLKLNAAPLSQSTFFTDTLPEPAQAYYVTYSDETPKRDSGNSSKLRTSQANTPYLSIPLQKPEAVRSEGLSYTYSANDASVGDLDGDGTYEIILKWQPSEVQNPPRPGLTGLQLIDAYTLDGTLLWRINLGKNIRAGAAYTQFLVYDLDGDGNAEIVCKTADGSTDGTGNVIGDATKDWRNLDPKSPLYGKIVEGPEYLSVFEGATGKVLDTQNYIPDRYPLNAWGGIGGNGNNDNTGGRADRFTAGVAYLDGKKPSVVFVRGWYGRTVAAAWNLNKGKLRSRWVFDSKDAKNPFSGQANHQLSIGDLDADGKDEICVGAMVIDDDGSGLYTTGLRHGDALHISDMDPDRPGLEVFGIHENEGRTLKLGTPGVALFDAATGNILFEKGRSIDVGRGVAADIDPTHPGFENWGGPGGLRDIHGNTISQNTPSSTNFMVWWDGDLTRELLDQNRIDKWNWQTQTTENLLTANGSVANNGTKATPCLSADLFGDWREEVIWRTPDSNELRIYSTTYPTAFRMPTLMQDAMYRLSIVWQNAAYNQPPHTSFNMLARYAKE